MEQLSVNPKLFTTTAPKLVTRFLGKESLFNSKLVSLLILLAGSAAAVLSSAKWDVSLFAWIAPVCWLAFFRLSQFKRKWLWFFPIILVTNIISSYDVAPFPPAVLVVLGILESLKFILIYISDRWIFQKSKQFVVTLFFPAASVAMEFLNANLGGGVWWSVANSQFGFKWLLQLSSVTGLWGISFLVYWFASIVIWAIRQKSADRVCRNGLLIFFGIFAFILFAGAIRYSIPDKTNRKVRMAGLSVPMMPYLEAIYRDYFGKRITIDPKTSISSAKLQEINKGQVPFIENTDTVLFKNSYNMLRQINDSLFILSQLAADQGAKIIIWSEANAIVFKSEENRFIERGMKFAKRNKVYLLMAVAAIHPGKISFGTKFLENQAVFFGPDGRVLNIFHKNNPVPMAEASIPGDGSIPVLETPYGRISTSICYDADFPGQMRQLSKNKSDLLLLPAGDWYAIAPYHTYIALFRGVENGASVVRQASGGLSAASDNKGRITTSMDFFNSAEKWWVADVMVGHLSTIYGQIGDAFAYACIFITVGGLLWGWIKRKEPVVPINK